MSGSNQLQRCSLHDLRLEDEKFTDKSEIKPWLHKTLLDKKGIEVVIYRSDSLKVVFKCRNGSREVVGSKNGDPRVPPRRQTTCPFKIRANYSFKNKFWSLVIMNDYHNHDVYIPAEISNPGSNTNVNSKNHTIKSNHKSNKGNHNNHTHNNNININSIIDGSNSHSTNMDGSFTEETAILASSHDSSKSGSTADVFGNLMESTTSSVSSVVLSSNHSPVDSSNSTFHTRPQSSPKQQRSYHGNNNSNNNNESSKFNPEQVVQYLRNEVNQLISKNIYKNNLIKEEDKSSVLDTFTQQLLLDHKDLLLLSNKELFNSSGNLTILPKPTKVEKPTRKRNVQSPRQKQQQQKKSILSSWLNTSNTNNPNLIPLSPLLNDSDNEYSTANTSNGATSIDNLHLPVINIGNNFNNSHPVNFVFPSQVSSQIQNQNQQLPSFNSIQNKLPLSPSGNSSFMNNSTTNIATTTSSLMPPIGNTPATLTPAHILESSNKNLFNLSSSSASAALSDFKIGGPMNNLGTNIFSGQSLLNGGPNIIPANVLKDTSNFLTSSTFNTLPSTNPQSRDSNSNSNSNANVGANGLLNNFNDSGW
ncbi:transcription factor AFT-domain-containing protein [Scheffersomyces coipomensis]|uniref:transcription factor AFT-domain-containing protein n=1 Tax=Scheffersomyces coipomensis TaxID=1788519 RepID=UPI00315D5004